MSAWQPEQDVEDLFVIGVPQSLRQAEPQLKSLGSVGHKEGQCGTPCRDRWRKDGCSMGWQCTRCHICRWSPAKAVEKAKDKAFEYIPGRAFLGALQF